MHLRWTNLIEILQDSILRKKYWPGRRSHSERLQNHHQASGDTSCSSMLRASRLLVFRSRGFSSPRRVGELVSSAGWTPCQSPRSWPCRWSWCWPARSSVFSSLPGCGSRIWCNETIAGSAGGPRPVDTIQISCWLCDTSDQISTSYLQLSYRLSLGWKRSICDNTKSSEWIK